MPLVQTSAPAVEPITLAEAKNHLRVDTDLTQDDALIAMLIGAARIYAETETCRSFISQQWRLVLDSFPSAGSGVMGVPWGSPWTMPANAIQLERGPVTTVDSITYTAMDGTTKTMPSTDYALDVSSPLARITPVFGKIWPIPLPQIGSVSVNYSAGYGSAAASVPPGIRQWMLMRLTTLYRNREEVAILGRGKVEALPYVDALLNPYRVPTL